MLFGLRRPRRAGAPAAGGSGQAAGLPVARIVLLASVTAAVLGAGVVYAVTRQPALGPGRGAARPQSVRGAAAPPGPLRVVSVSPAGGARGVDGAGPVRVTFSVPLAQDSPLPTLAPAIRGTWQRTGTAAVTFAPATAFPPLTSVRVIIPGGRRGVRSAAGRLLHGQVVARFRTGRWRRLRFEQLLAQLGYLPLSWAPGRSAGRPAIPPRSGGCGRRVRTASFCAVPSRPSSRTTASRCTASSARRRGGRCCELPRPGRTTPLATLTPW